MTVIFFFAKQLINVETDEVTVDEDIADDITIDDSEFDSSVVGIYNIYVSYTRSGVTRTKSYTVEVIGTDAAFGGIEVEYAAGTVNRVTLQPGTQTTTITTDGIVVKQIDTSGNVTGTVSSSDYNLELYKGTVKQESWTVGGGAKQIVGKTYWVSPEGTETGTGNNVSYVVEAPYLQLNNVGSQKAGS